MYYRSVGQPIYPRRPLSLIEKVLIEIIIGAIVIIALK